jgi:phosphate/sulfate permease
MGTKIASGKADYMAVHIRRGDRKAMSWQNFGKFVPIQDYVQALGDTSARLSLSQIYLATDSPDALAEFEKAIQEKTGAKPPIHSLDGSDKSELKELASDRDYVQGEWDQRDDESRIRLTTGAIVDFAMISGFWTGSNDVATAVGPRAVICTIT